MAAIAEAVRHMLAAGMPADTIVAAIADMEAAAGPYPKTRSAHAERQARYRERKASQSVTSDVTVTPVTSQPSLSDASPSPSPAPSPDKEIPPTPPKENNLFPLPPSTPRVSGGREQAMFDRFWEVYPNKVGKADARKAFSKALTRTSAEEMAAGLHRYIAKTDDRPWCNPATWLNQDRWGDMPAEVARGSPRGENAVERQVRELKGKIENDYGFGRQESGNFGDADGLPLLIAARRSPG